MNIKQRFLDWLLPTKSSNRAQHDHIQRKLIDIAKEQRARRSDKLVWDGLTRDSRYYRVKFGSNKNRFKPISFLN